MFDETLVKDLIEMYGKNLTFTDIETVGGYLFKQRAFTIELDGSPLNNTVDICQNSELVKKYKTKIMEKVYYRLWAFLKAKLDHWEGRIWNWAGDGGILAFRGDQGVTAAVSCCLEILATLTMSVSESVHARLTHPCSICSRTR